MLSRLASRGSYGWLFAVGMAAGVAFAVVVVPAKPTPPAPMCTGIEPMAIVPASGECTDADELARATAVIHYFDEEVRYATAADPMSAKMDALLSLPMMCTSSRYWYPALSKHFESAATVALERGDKQMVRRLVEVGRAYNVDDRMLDSMISAIVK
jgi:hypothetical protein